MTTMLRYRGFQLMLDDAGKVVELRQNEVPVHGAGSFRSVQEAQRWIDTYLHSPPRRPRVPED